MCVYVCSVYWISCVIKSPRFEEIFFFSLLLFAVDIVVVFAFGRPQIGNCVWHTKLRIITLRLIKRTYWRWWMELGATSSNDSGNFIVFIYSFRLHHGFYTRITTIRSAHTVRSTQKCSKIVCVCACLLFSFTIYRKQKAKALKSLLYIECRTRVCVIDWAILFISVSSLLLLLLFSFHFSSVFFLLRRC